MNLAGLNENSLSAFDTLSLLVADEMTRVDAVIDANLKSDIPLIEQIAKHIIYSGGKRLRPALVLLTSHLYGNKTTSKTIALAAAVEFIHTATLLHDDVIDESDLRRGVPSAHTVWGNTAAILVGDFLFAKAFELMVQTGDLRILKILSKTSAVISSGEVQQLVETHNFRISSETALKIIGAKTGELFGAACQTGALVAGTPEEEALHLYHYGYNLGLIFQITDDVLDYQTQDNTRGKIPGDDFREGKITLPVIYAYSNASLEEKEFFYRTMIERQQTPEDLTCACQLIEQHHGFTKSLDLAKSLAHETKEMLKTYAIPMTDLLSELLSECLRRSK